MDEIVATGIIGLGTSLTELALKGTATAVSNKIKLLKDEKQSEVIKNTYEEIVNELLSEREEAVRIAQAYKSELEKVNISDEDIQHLYNTVERLLELFKENNLHDGKENNLSKQIDAIEQVKELISVDTLKTMQLLGFNYRAAIGEPLTIIIRNWFLSKVPSTDELNNFDRIIKPEMVEILKNEKAYENFKELMGMERKHPN